jgi:serine phosphatase RsbU (regulator of sigma subunit)
MAQKPAIRLCLVDDDEDYYIITRDLLADIPSYEFSLTWISTFEHAIEEIPGSSFDVLVFDYNLGARNGLELLRRVLATGLRAPVIMLTGQGDRAVDLEAMKAGAADYLVKGKIDSVQFERSIRYCMDRFATMEQLRSSRDSLRHTTQRLEAALASINDELETARRVQKSLLPQTVDRFPGLDFSGAYHPDGMIGGDMYDVVKIDDTHVAFLILDVCGHGAAAALITAMAKVSFTRCILKETSPKSIFTQVNAELCRFMPEGRYVTAFLAVLDLEKRELGFSRAGHPPALLSSGRGVEYLSTGAPLIGCFTDSQFEESTAVVSSGDTIALYTDGIVEGLNPAGDRYPMLAMENIMRGAREKSAADVSAAIIDSFRNFSGAVPQSDDITVLVVKVL